MLFRRFVRSVARRLLYPAVETLTKQALLLTHRGIIHPSARPLVTGGFRVLVVAAHPDDETIGCYAAINEHLQAGDTVHALIVTDGSGSRAGGLSPQAMAALRHEEVDALRRLVPGAEVLELSLREGSWRSSELRTHLSGTMKRMQPNVIYAPSCVDFHPEHLKVARAVSDVLGEIPPDRTLRIRAYEMQVPLGPELANRYVVLNAPAYQAKRNAVSVYRSQEGALELWQRMARYNGALLGVGRPAELFLELSIPAYRRLVSFGEWNWRTTPFRSLTGRPFRDYLAYRQGASVRAQLRLFAERAVTTSRISYNVSHTCSDRLYKMLRRMARPFSAARWRLVPPDYAKTYHLRVGGFQLLVLPTVFHPLWHRTSVFMAGFCARALTGSAASVLELGTGTGIVAVSVARKSCKVIATDLNPQAVRCAKLNAIRNGLRNRVEVRSGDMFGPVAGMRFDVILCNPPYFRGTPSDDVGLAYYGGESLQWLVRLGREAHEYLLPGGKLLCVFGSAADVPGLVRLIAQQGWSARRVAYRRTILEDLSVYAFTPCRGLTG